MALINYDSMNYEAKIRVMDQRSEDRKDEMDFNMAVYMGVINNPSSTEEQKIEAGEVWKKEFEEIRLRYKY